MIKQIYNTVSESICITQQVTLTVSIQQPVHFTSASDAVKFRCEWSVQQLMAGVLHCPCCLHGVTRTT